MIMSHRINQTSNALQLKPLMEKFYFYWGLAVRSLNEYLNMEDKRAGNTIIAGILTLLLADVSLFCPKMRQGYSVCLRDYFLSRSTKEGRSIGDAIYAQYTN
jgi:hypothetical protein